VLPPAVAGIGLLAAFGRLGLLGGHARALGVRIGFTQAASCSRSSFVAGPFYLRPAIAPSRRSTRRCSPRPERSAPGPGRTFAASALPLAGSG
jgi:molybdate transport system permease protein